MANKVHALLIMCIVIAAAVQLRETEALVDEYASCFTNCHKECEDEGNGSTFCEMKCDGDCVAKETAAKLNLKMP